MRKTILGAAITVALATSALPTASLAANSSELAEVKQMIEQMREQYEARIRNLEERVRVAEGKATEAQKTAASNESRVAEFEVTNQNRGDNSFNPAISLVLQAGVANYSLDPEEYHMDGLPLGGEAGLQSEGLSMWETELTASANIDNLFYGQATIGLHSHDDELEVDLEEAFVDTLSLPAGLGIRGGRFFSDFGYLNAHHSHAWDFADAPLAYTAFLGGQYRDDGVRATWVAPTDDIFVEVGAEVMRGGAYPGGGQTGDLGAVQLGFVHIGGDVGDNNSWQLGVSHMEVDVASRTAGGHAHDGEEGATFVGDSELTGIDLVWKTDLPGGKALILQGEYMTRDENGQVTVSETAGDAIFNYNGEQSGWYAQGIFQFDPQWRAGVRYDRVEADNVLAMVSNATGESDADIFEESGFESSDHDPHRWTAMLDWTPSEFSRVRLQYAHDKSRTETDNQFMLQYIMTLGAHGAHQY